MRPAVFISDLTDHNLRLAAQSGATDLVAPCPGFSVHAVQELVSRAAAHRLNLSVIERFVPHHKIVHHLPGWEREVEDIKQLIAAMGQAGVEVLCYNWMP